MEINVGDYVRYKEFSYDKEVNIGKKIDTFGNVDTSRGRILGHNITNHSKDIIDLIEVGDYVNGHRINDIINNKLDLEGCTHDNDDEPDWYELKKGDKIVTKEQFENLEYKIGGE